MGEAEDAVRAQNAERDRYEQDGNDRAAVQRAAKLERIRAAVPPIVEARKANGYQGGKLVPISVEMVTKRKYRQDKTEWVKEERAIWQVWSKNMGTDPAVTLWMTADGRFVYNNGIGMSYSYVDLDWIASSEDMLKRTDDSLKQQLWELTRT